MIKTFIPNAIGVAATDTATLNALLAVIGSSQATIQFPASLDPTKLCKLNSITFPSNITLDFTNGGIQVVTGQTVTVQGPVIATLQKIFYNALSGQGTILWTGNKSLIDIDSRWWGATGDDVANDTAAIKAAGASMISGMTFNFSQGRYKISITEGTALISFANKSNITIKGNGTTIHDTSTYTYGPDPEFTPMFEFNASSNIVVDGVNYLGDPVTLATDLGYKGGTFVYAKNGCQNITVNAQIDNARYGVASGRYSDETRGYNKTFRFDLKTLSTGYPIAHYLAEDVQGTINAENTHRAAYLAGVNGINVRAFFKNQYVADVQVLLTDARTGDGTSRGCSNAVIEAVDMGSTHMGGWVPSDDPIVPRSWATGISLSRADPGIIYENIRVRFSVRGTDTVASTLGGFIVVGSGLPAEYLFNWEPTITIRNLTVSGIVDRSAQTVAGNPVGEIYFYTLDGEVIDGHYATVDNITFENVIIKDASTPNPRDNYFVVPGLQRNMEFHLCDFSTVGLLVQTNLTSLTTFFDSAIKYTHPVDLDDSRIALMNTVVSDSTKFTPLTNKVLFNSPIAGAGAFQRANHKELTLSGASTTWTNAIPAGCVVEFVVGRITETIPGGLTTGYQVGVSGDLTRYANLNDLTAGLTFDLAASTETGSRNYPLATDIIVTAKTSNFTGGKLRLFVFYKKATSPTN